MLSKTSAFVKSHDGKTKWMSFFIKDVNLLKKYSNIRNKVSNSFKKEHDCEPIYIKKKILIMIKIFIVEKYLNQALIMFACRYY